MTPDYLQAIKEHKIHLEPEYSEGDKEEPDGYFVGWQGFPSADGGCWSEGETIEECVDNVIKSLEEDK